MNLKYHGLVLRGADSGELRFGIAQLINRCLSWRWSGSGKMSESPKDTLARFDNRTYWQCAAKCRDTVHKLDKAISYLGREMDTFEREDDFAFEGAPLEKAVVWLPAADGLPYHLDSLLAYLRILADCVAFSVPFFFRTKESIANRSFRDQRKWFLAKRPDFDPAYTKVLKEQTEWFEKLAGKDPKGVRDLHFHQFATYQLGSVTYPTGERTISVQQVTAEGIKDPDLTFTLSAMIEEFFAYLDTVYTLFTDRLAGECTALMEGPPEERSVFMRYTGCPQLRERYRLYPLIETEEDAEPRNAVDRIRAAASRPPVPDH
jgi:hypothetical protein